MSESSFPLVSVIVPCYQVEKYVEKSIGSLIQQTYPNIEIFAIDDGSPDRTPAILDELARMYKRVHVVHQQNAGVASARNTGLRYSKGEYIMFLDGDDWLAPDAVEYFVNLAQVTQSDFCLSLNCFTKQNESQIQQEEIKTISPAQATSLLLSPRVIVGCWNKIYRRRMIEKYSCKFNANLFYGEGLLFITTFAQLVPCVGIGCRKVYYYRRDNESSACTRFNIENVGNGEKALDCIEKQLQLHTPDIHIMLLLHRSMFYMAAAVRMINNHCTKTYSDIYKKCLSYVRKNYFKLLSASQVPLYRKCLLGFGCICPWLLAKLDIIRRKRIVRRSVQ